MLTTVLGRSWSESRSTWAMSPMISQSPPILLFVLIAWGSVAEPSSFFIHSLLFSVVVEPGDEWECGRVLYCPALQPPGWLGALLPSSMATITWRCQFVSHHHLTWDIYSDWQSMVPSAQPSCRRYGLLP